MIPKISLIALTPMKRKEARLICMGPGQKRQAHLTSLTKKELDIRAQAQSKMLGLKMCEGFMIGVGQVDTHHVSTSVHL